MRKATGWSVSTDATRRSDRATRHAGWLLALAPCFAAAQTAPHAAVGLDPHVLLVPGGLWNEAGLGPDGNTVVFRAADGDVVLDSGRHRQHADDVLKAMEGRPLLALANSHWHLDHASNNFVFLRAFPSAELIATDAVDGALAGFLARSRTQGGAKPPADGDAAARRARFEWVLDHPQYLRAKAPLEKDAVRHWKNLALEFKVERQAVTDADLWVYDPAAELVASGDLVTLPVPFFDTACPAGWERALARIDRTPFARLVPGHGRVLTHEEFSLYRRSLSQLLACARDGTAQACAQGWADAVAPLLESTAEAALARDWTAGYLQEFLLPGAPRANAYCHEKG